MRFPKQVLDVAQYQQTIANMLVDRDCHLFIDTNIISQLYKLNDEARTDFFNWISTVSNRFHVPNWTVHEYQKRYVSQKTKDYLSELDNKELVKKLKNLSNFVRGYVSDSLLVGNTEYGGRKEQLFDDLDGIVVKFEKINNAIKKDLHNHQLNVHLEILQHLQQYTMNSNIYSIIDNIGCNGEIRYTHMIPPGFQDSNKDENKFGDLVIWNEILNFCNQQYIKKAIWITRDSKSDITYTPQKQVLAGNPINDAKIAIAHESLVYEFFLNTKSQEFYVIDFLELVRSISSSYEKLALSFQIVTAPHDEPYTICHQESSVMELEPVHQQDQAEDHNNLPDIVYSNDALADADFDVKCIDPFAKAMIVDLKTHNWYKQNDAAKFLMKWAPSVEPASVHGRDIMFVLGRNIYQSAEGTANDAIRFIQNLRVYIQNWDVREQQGFIDGMMYEVFFDSHGIIRSGKFKTRYFDYLLSQIDMLELDHPYEYINSSLFSNRNLRFTPEVHTDKRYTFEFEFSDVDQFGLAQTSSIKIDGRDESATFTDAFSFMFAGRDEIKQKLASYYAVPANQIDIVGIGNEIEGITLIGNI